MSDDERSSFDKLPKVLVFDGDAESYLDADEAYQRWARRHYKGGLDKWIYGGKCPIKPGMDQAEIARICHLVIASTTRTHPKYAEVLWDSLLFWTQSGLEQWYADQLQELYDYVDPRTKGKARIELRKLKRSGELGNLSAILEQEFGGGALAAADSC